MKPIQTTIHPVSALAGAAVLAMVFMLSSSQGLMRPPLKEESGRKLPAQKEAVAFPVSVSIDSLPSITVEAVPTLHVGPGA